jgi:hypothetical protein
VAARVETLPARLVQVRKVGGVCFVQLFDWLVGLGDDALLASVVDHAGAALKSVSEGALPLQVRLGHLDERRSVVVVVEVGAAVNGGQHRDRRRFLAPGRTDWPRLLQLARAISAFLGRTGRFWIVYLYVVAAYYDLLFGLGTHELSLVLLLPRVIHNVD